VPPIGSNNTPRERNIQVAPLTLRDPGRGDKISPTSPYTPGPLDGRDNSQDDVIEGVTNAEGNAQSIPVTATSWGRSRTVPARRQ